MTESRLVSVLIALALVTGIATFHRAFEPGRSERNGPNTDLAQGDRLKIANWLPDAGGGRYELSRGALRLHTTGAGAVLVSRTLAVFPRTCYRLTVRASARGDGLRIVVKDERARHTIAAVSVPRSPEALSTSRQVDTGEHRRVTLTVESDRPLVSDVHQISLKREDSAPCGRSSEAPRRTASRVAR